ncbi:MAG: MoaD/ThiS family protein [Bryobacterales bacterium]|nr:MoaD/ThiS family protein [Bryobacterales bacterium]
MARVFIPTLLRQLTNCADAEVAGGTLGQILDRLESLYPGIGARLSGAAIAVDGEVTTLGRLEPVSPESEVHFVAAIKGGTGLLAGQRPR